MNLDEAKIKFSELLLGVRPSDREDVITWIKNSEEIQDFVSDSRIKILESIGQYLRRVIPSSGVLEGESLNEYEGNENCESDHIDAFIYPDDELDDLCEKGAMSRHYCRSCGSRQILPLNLYSHSFSAWELKWLFTRILPPLGDKLLLDVGSRHGAVLYGASEFSTASKIIGVEMNEEFCKITEAVIDLFSYTRIDVVNDDIRNQKELLSRADVIVLNNVFEQFLSEDDQVKCWNFIFSCVKRPGTVLVTVPSINQCLDNLNMSMPTGWAEEMHYDFENELVPDEVDLDSLGEICLYRVL